MICTVIYLNILLPCRNNVALASVVEKRLYAMMKITLINKYAKWRNKNFSHRFQLFFYCCNACLIMLLISTFKNFVVKMHLKFFSQFILHKVSWEKIALYLLRGLSMDEQAEGKVVNYEKQKKIAMGRKTVDRRGWSWIFYKETFPFKLIMNIIDYDLMNNFNWRGVGIIVYNWIYGLVFKICGPWLNGFW